MKVKGVWLEDAHQLQPDQWVNVWDVDVSGDCVFYATCQVKDVSNLDIESMFDCGLEPISDEEAA